MDWVGHAAERLLSFVGQQWMAAGSIAFVIAALALQSAWARPRAKVGSRAPAAPSQSQTEPEQSRIEPTFTPPPVAAQIAPALVTAALPVIEEDEERRSVRVFVSSTFLDMQAERDVLVTKAFPALRAKYRARGVEIFEVDLRWGITREQQERGETLPTLLSEIDRCRPYFVGLLGDRYGWIPPPAALTDKLRADYPAIAEANGASVTALEIMHGVLSNPTTAERAIFFERDPAWDWLSTLDASDRSAAETETDAERGKLAELKSMIRRKARVEAYARPEDIGQKVTDALDVLLHARFPEADAPDAFEQSARLHRAYARDRRGLHVGAEGYIADLNCWMDTPGAAPRLIAGASGGGKSTLMANWVHAWRNAHPESQAFVFEHYLAASPDSAEPTLIIRRLWEHLNRATGDVSDLPRENAELMDMSSALAQRLAQARLHAGRDGARLLIALDGLDKLSSGQNLNWLPLVSGVHVLVSSLGGEAKSAALSRGFKLLEVKPLSSEEQEALVASTLLLWRRALEPQYIARMLVPAAPELAGSPLYLKTVLEELRVSADHASLAQRIEDYRGSCDMPDLFARVLKRLEDDCEPGLVEKALPLIWASRAGLEETVIIAVAEAAPLAWATLRNGLGDGLREHRGRLAFSHDYLWQAVGRRYLAEDETRRVVHNELANYFEKHEPDARQAEELPHQLRAAEEWNRLEALLVDLDRFELSHARGNAELLSYWLVLKERGREPEALLCQAFDVAAGAPQNWSDSTRRLAAGLGEFLTFAGLHGSATERLARNLHEALLSAFGPNHIDTAIAADNLGEILIKRGRLQDSLSARKGAVDALTLALGPTNPTTFRAKCNLANTVLMMGDLESATRALEDLVVTCTETYGPSHEQTLAVKSNLAEALKTKGSLERALKIETEILVTHKQTLGVEHHDTLVSMNNLATTYFNLNMPQEALPLQSTVVDARARLFGKEHPETLKATNNLAETRKALGDLNGALSMHEEVLKCRLRVLGKMHPSTLMSLSNLAHTLTLLRRFDQALPLQEEVLQARVEALGEDHPDTLIAMNNVAVSLVSLGQLVRAMPVAERVLKGMTSVFGPLHPQTKNAAMGVMLIKDMSNRRARLDDQI